MKKIVKIFFSVWLCLCIIGTVSFFAVGNAIFNYALVRNGNSGGYTNEENNRWLVKNSTDKYIVSEDGLDLHGHLAENPDADGRYAIICHGYSGKATAMTRYAKAIYEMGFSVLCPNSRAHGKSQGEITGMGYLEKRDVLIWINAILEADPNAEILLFGVSMGAATMLFASGESDLPQNVKAVVSDCAFTRVYEQFGNVIRNYVPFLPDFPVVDSVSVVSEIKGGYSFRDASCIEAVKRSSIPTLFIHGSADTFVPFHMLDILYENAACEKQKLVIEGAGHADSMEKNPDLYWDTVESFINQYI